MITRKSLIFLLISIPALMSRPSFASVYNLQQNLETITADFDSHAGIKVVSLDEKETLYSKNPDTPLNPASTAKIITAAAALKYLGPNFMFHTKFYLSPEDDLYIYGEGDPSIVVEEMRIIANEIRQKVTGRIRNIVVNDSYFDGYTAPGLPEDKSHYNSFTGALSMNFNRIKLTVSPAKNVGEPANVIADAGKVTIDINNGVKTSRRKSGTYISFRPPQDADDEHFTVDGHIQVNSRAKTFWHHVDLPPLYFAETLKTLLKEKGVKIYGGIFRGEKPEKTRLIVDHKSKPLYEIVSDMNKHSNNFTAEQLTKTLGAAYLGAPGSTQKGTALFSKYLSSLGVNPQDFRLVNGSGLSYDNRISASALIKVFQDMYDHPKLWSYFKESLSIWGKDGTLRRRKKDGILKNRVWAKTGSVDNVRTIAGVIPTDDDTIAFAILLNGHSAAGARQTQTKIAESIAKFRK